MSALAFLTSWANAPFAVAVGAVGVFALLQATGLLGLIAGAGEGDHDIDHDVDVDVDADADADHDVGHDADADQDGDGDGHGHGFAAAALGALGFGTLPLSVLWQTFALAFGVAGFLMNARYFQHAGGPPVHTLAWTLPAALAGGCGAVVGMTRILGPVLSSKGQEATSRAQLVGQIGVVISSKVDREFGEIRIRDRSGHDLRVVCKLTDQAKAVPLEGQSVVVVECDDRGGLLVAPLEEPLEPERDGEAGEAERGVVDRRASR